MVLRSTVNRQIRTREGFDVKIMRQIIRLRKTLYDIISARTGKSVEAIEKDCDRNKWLDAPGAIDYGLGDAILERMPAND